METHNSIARNGGWKVWAALDGQLLQDPYRHHVIAATVASEEYVLPPLLVGNGRGHPLGTRLWVYNTSKSHVGQIRNSDSSQTWGLLASTAACFILTGEVGGASQWIRTVSSAPTGIGSPVPTGFNMTVEIFNSKNNVDLLAEAVAKGYDGTEPGLIRCVIHPGVVIGSVHRNVPALTTGGDTAIEGVNWFAGTLVYIEIGAGAYVSGYGGKGGSGGIGGTGGAPGLAGEDGGLAFRAKISAVINSSGTIQAGGGGGGGGDGQAANIGISGGGGGGGAGANVTSSLYVSGGEGGDGAVMGTEGSLTQSGYGGPGSTSPPDVGGTGGNGGAPGVAGASGSTVNNAGTQAAGGAAGTAISRDAAATVTFLPSAGGTVTGPQVVV